MGKEASLVAEMPPAQVEVSEGEQVFGNSLYGVDLLLQHGETPELLEYLPLQARTHIQEGIRLQQKTTTTYSYNGSHVIDERNIPFVVTCDNGHQARLKDNSRNPENIFWFMESRTDHDKTNANANDNLMKNGGIGDMRIMASPFQEEVDVNIAREAGFWPETRRGYLWFNRKVSETELETTVVSIDGASVEAYAALLRKMGQNIPPTAKSHDIPGYQSELLSAAASDEERDQFIESCINELELHSQTARPELDMTSDEFIFKFGKKEIHEAVRLQREIARSARSMQLTPYVQATVQAVLGEAFINDTQRRQFMRVLNIDHFRFEECRSTMGSLIDAHNIGGWRTLSHRLKKIVQEGHFEPQATKLLQPEQYVLGSDITMEQRRYLESLARQTAEVAREGGFMPGCPGGKSFLEQEAGILKEQAFEKEKSFEMKKVEKCPLCNEQNVTAIIDRNANGKRGTISCSDCKRSVDLCTGDVLVTLGSMVEQLRNNRKGAKKVLEMAA